MISLSYDQHGRKRKTKATNRKRTTKKELDKQFTGSSGRATSVALERARADRNKYPSRHEPASSTSGRKRDNAIEVEVSKGYTIAPAFNKGAYQVIPNSDVKEIGRK